MNENVLAILITVRNAGAAVAQVNAVKGSLDEAAISARASAAAFKTLAAAAVVLGLALRAAGNDEAMRLQLQAITHDGAIAWSQIRAIREESEKGLFDKESLFQARKVFDETGASIKDLLPLAEDLSLRSQKGLGDVARVIGGLAGGGMSRLGLFLRAAGLTVNELRNAGLAITKNYQVSGSPTQVIEALRKVLGKENISGALGGSLNAEFKGVAASLTDLFRSIGDGLLPIIKPVLTFMAGLLKVMAAINDATHGWAANVVLAVGAMRTVAVLIPILERLTLVTKLAAFWTGLLRFLNGGWAEVAATLEAVVIVVRQLATVEKLTAAWAAVMDALTGNWGALAAGAAVAAAVGIAWHFTGGAGNQEQDAPAAERPRRRSDVENMLNRARAKSFS